MALKVRRGDTVQVIAGKDSGKQGRVLRVEPSPVDVPHEDVVAAGPRSMAQVPKA